MTNARKPVFDAVGQLVPGIWNDRGNILAMDNLLDAFGAPHAGASPKPHGGGALHIGPAGIALIQQFEGCARKRPDGMVEAYPDPGTGGAPWTIGWGATGRSIRQGTVWTQAQCDARFESDLERYPAAVIRAIGNAPTSQAQFDALVSFHYNTGAIGRATLTKKHVAGDFAGAAREFGRWTRAGGRVMKGLVRRRNAEADLYRSGS